MIWGDRASARFSAELIEEKASLGRWLGAILKVVLVQETPNTDVIFELVIKDERTGAVVYREKGNSVTGEEALRLAEGRLEQMTVAEFAETYSFPLPE